MRCTQGLHGWGGVGGQEGRKGWQMGWGDLEGQALMWFVYCDGRSFRKEFAGL